MKKQRVQLLSLLIVLILLVGSYFGIRKYNDIQAQKPEETTDIALLDLEQDDIIRLKCDYGDYQYEYEKADGTWYYSQDPSLTLTQYRLNNIASTYASLAAQEVIENVTDPDQYGLKNPSGKMTIQTADAQYTYLIGDYNSISGIYYLAQADSDQSDAAQTDISTVYAVKSNIVTCLKLDVEDIIEEEEESTETTETTEMTETEETAGTEEAAESEETAETTAPNS